MKIQKYFFDKNYLFWYVKYKNNLSNEIIIENIIKYWS